MKHRYMIETFDVDAKICANCQHYNNVMGRCKKHGMAMSSFEDCSSFKVLK